MATLSDEEQYSSTVTALLTLEGLGISLGLVLLLASLVHQVFIDKLKSICIIIQSQVNNSILEYSVR